MDPYNISTTIPIPMFSSSSFISSITTRMDPRIWSRLPQRLIDRVIAFLPTPAFFRSRCVCKRWYSLLYSEAFLAMYLSISSSPSQHWFLFFKHKSLESYIYRNSTSGGSGSGSGSGSGNIDKDNCEGYLYDPYDRKWYRLNFASMVPSGFSPASSSSGLVCWVSDDAGPKCMLLCNPLLKTFTQLPPTLRPRLFPSIDLVVTKDSSLDVVVAGDDLISPFAVKNLTTESFHVDSGGYYSVWGTTSALPRLCSLESGRMVYVEGSFYCMNYSPYSILSYDIRVNQWHKIQAPMRRFLRSPSLVVCQGRLILVAAVEKSKLNVPRSMRFWGLQEHGSTWVEVERMPQPLYDNFSEIENGHGFDCIGHGDFITITISGSDRTVLFDLYQKDWQWIPRCPFIQSGSVGGGGGGGGGLHGFPYEPRLATPAMGLVEQAVFPFQSFNA